MTQPIRLYSIQDIEKAITDCEATHGELDKYAFSQVSGVFVFQAMRQLADTIRENERLRSAVEIVAKDGTTNQWAATILKQALSYKESDHEK